MARGLGYNTRGLGFRVQGYTGLHADWGNDGGTHGKKMDHEMDTAVLLGFLMRLEM